MCRQKGFTLFELMLVLVIVAVLIFFAQPFYWGIMQRVESHAIRRHIHDAIRLAKVESRIRNKDVLICIMSDDVCHRNAQGSLIVFVDMNKNNKYDNKDIIVSKERLSLKYGIISVNASANRDYMKFMGDTGRPRGNFGHIKYCNVLKQEYHSFQVVVNMHGLVSEKRGDRLDIGC
ncbi:GspH/FimT family pseudopilin [Moraxella oculi]|uniref:Type II secretion system protein H n=1 Tax=Moraxella oculi TaxID=2940516 RepID=A0ABW8U6X7_9GAMM